MDNTRIKLPENNIEIKAMQRSDGTHYSIRSNRQRFFFPDEWMAFYDKLKDRQKITFEMLINTGARINEIRNEI
jgi:integrase